MLILSIDPGLTGAYALLAPDGELIAARDLPIVQEPHGKKTRSVISAALFHDAILGAPSKISHAIYEQVTASPQMGVVSAFRMGQGVGVIGAVLQCCGIRTVTARPNVWKRALGLSPDKEVSRARAIELWPDQSPLFARKLDHNRAEAALLAEYARRNP